MGTEKKLWTGQCGRPGCLLSYSIGLAAESCQLELLIQSLTERIKHITHFGTETLTLKGTGSKLDGKEVGTKTTLT